jgi:hypothetical protein
MTQQHPITPPRELVAMWAGFSARHHSAGSVDYVLDLATKAAQWGADTELEACCEWVGAVDGKYGRRLRLARRPKPPSLKEQSIALLDLIQGNKKPWQLEDLDVVRRALESIPDPSY